MKTRSTKVLALLIVLVLLFSMSACGGNNAGDKKSSVALRVGTSEPAGSMLVGAAEIKIPIALVFDYIFYADSGTGKMASDILEGWTFSDNGKSATLKLREDIVFSNGEKATGEDLLFSIASLAPGHERAYAGMGVDDSWDLAGAVLESDGYSVTVTVTEGYAAINCLEAFFEQQLLCKSWCEKTGWDSDLWFNGPVGSGPFEVAEFVTDNYYLLKARADWWMDEELDIGYDEIKITCYSELSTMYMDLENGDLDIALVIAANDYERAVSSGGKIKTELISGHAGQYMYLDIDDSPFSDINVRKAFAHGVDWAAVMTVGYENLWQPATSIVPSNYLYYKNVGNYEFDQEYAKQCLEAAGYGPGELTLEIYVCPGELENMAVSVQYYLNQIGINLVFYSYDFSTTQFNWLAGDGDMQLQSIPGGYPHHNPLRLCAGLIDGAMPNMISKTDTTTIDLYTKAVMATDESEVAEYIGDLQQHVYDSYRLIVTQEMVNAVAWNSEVVKELGIFNAKSTDLRFVVMA